MWTRFWDMHSGGKTKLPPFETIYVALPEEEARVFFEQVFGRDPDYVTCNCCGSDYSVSTEDESLVEATAYHRHDTPSSAYMRQQYPGMYERVSLEDYLTKDTVLVVYADGSTNHPGISGRIKELKGR